MPRTRSTAAWASVRVPKVSVSTYVAVRISRGHGSSRNPPENRATPSMATGCSACSSSARSPPTE